VGQSVIPVLGRLKQQDREFGASLGYTARPCLKSKTKQKFDYIIRKICPAKNISKVK
jgi:hypothetical protein